MSKLSPTSSLNASVYMLYFGMFVKIPTSILDELSWDVCTLLRVFFVTKLTLTGCVILFLLDLYQFLSLLHLSKLQHYFREIGSVKRFQTFLTKIVDLENQEDV